MFLSLISILFMPFITIASKDMQIFRAIDIAVIDSKRVRIKGERKAQVCYEGIGCFQRDGPMKHIGLLPNSPDKINTRFFVYTHFSSKNGLELDPKSPQNLSLLIPNQTLAIIIHGFDNNANKSELLTLKDSLIQFTYISTVILVDWHMGAIGPWYTEAATNTQVVGRQIASMVNTLRLNCGCNPYDVHIFGFSLGAHIAGFAGKYSQMQYNWKFGRISALDAAGPLFEGFEGSYLTKDDAYFVDVIHTNAGSKVLKGQLGFSSSIGHIDFYPNNGTRQPRCKHLARLSTCDHNSAIHYMSASLRAHSLCTFIAFKCNSWQQFISGRCRDRKGRAVMGYLSVLSKSSGNHYLKTSSKYPFCSLNSK